MRPAPRAWYLIYNVLLHLGALVCLPVWLFVRVFRGRYRGQFAERMGRLPGDLRRRFEGPGPSVWVHAASAGETTAAAPLVEELRARLPGHRIFFTVTSRYGKQMAEKRLGGLADGIAYSPLDLPLFDRRVLERIRPRLYVMVETDLWPNLVRLARARGARIALASGHAGPRSFPRPFWRAVLSQVDLFLMQSEEDARHLVRRGAPPERVRVEGNLKYEGSGRPLPPEELPAWRRELGLPEQVPVLVAGSTLAEDEAPLLDALAALRRAGYDLHAVIAPRRRERIGELERGCAARGLGVARRTAGGPGEVRLLDTMGELAAVYNLADVAYVGGGFTPQVGLHNLLEPLACGVPVLMGPHRGKAGRIAAEVLAAGAGLVVDGPASLRETLRTLLEDREERVRRGAAGARVFARHRGAAARTAEALAALLAEEAA